MKKIFYIFALCVCVLAMPLKATAQSVGADASAQGPCTTSPTYDFNVAGDGIVTEVVTHIRGLVDDTSQDMYDAITGNDSFKLAFSGALTLFITLYGAAALMGLVQIRLDDAIVRLAKLGFVVAVVTSWTFLHDNIMNFFNDGTDDIINKMTAVAIGVPVDQGAGPLVVLDGVINISFGVKMIITLVALIFNNWPWGPIFFLLILWGLGTAFRAVFSAVWIYLMSLIAKALLFGLAPIFVICLLFNRTKHLFEGWLSQLINYSLQPILLFAFLGFYMVLIEASLKEILQVDLCYRPVESLFAGLPNMIWGWQFLKNGEIFDGAWGVETEYPIKLVPVLIFILLAQLAFRHTQIIQVLAREISGSTVALSDLRPGLMDAAGSVEQRAKAAMEGAALGHSDGGGGRGVGGGVGARQNIPG